MSECGIRLVDRIAGNNYRTYMATYCNINIIWIHNNKISYRYLGLELYLNIVNIVRRHKTNSHYK